MRRQLLEFQCDRIEAVLKRHNVSAQVTGAIVSPRWIRFQVLPTIGARVKKVIGLAEEIALALDSSTCRISRQGGKLAVEIPRPNPQPVRLLALQGSLSQDTLRRRPQRRTANQGTAATRPQALPFGAAVLGLAEDGTTLLVRLPAPQVAHVLIAGTTGSGKSALAQTLVASLAMSHRPHQMGIVLIDPKRRAFGALAGLPHLLRPVLSEPEAVCETLQRLVELMLARDRASRTIADTHRAGEPRLVVVIDELADLLMTSGKEAHTALTRLVQRGRAAGIHVVACTQKPASQIVGSLAKANFPVRLVGRVTSPEDAKVATGYAGTGAERLLGPGDFIAVNGGQIIRFQAAYISARELANLVSQLLEAEHKANWNAARPAEIVFRSRASTTGLFQHSRPKGFFHSESIGRLSQGARRRIRAAARSDPA